MPERPDLEYQVPLLAAELVGRTVTGWHVKLPVVLRIAVPGDPAVAIVGRTFESVERRGPFVRFVLGDVEMIVHPMLAGRFTIAEAGAKGHRDLALTLDLDLDDDRHLRYRDDKEMGKVYLVPRDRHEAVAGFDRVGLDVLDPGVFTREAFRAVAKKRREQAKIFLMDHAALDCLGNAYADESLWAAGIHPKTRMSELSAEQLDALHDAVAETVRNACDEIQRQKPALDEKLRDFLGVRNRKGQPCPRCGTTVRVCGIHGHDAFFCPTCQPDAKGRGFVDWSKLRR